MGVWDSIDIDICKVGFTLEGLPEPPELPEET
jgi:hypothetical protein